MRAPLPGIAGAGDKAGDGRPAPPKDAWLNAIMSKPQPRESQVASPSAAAHSAPTEPQMRRPTRPGREYTSEALKPPYRDPGGEGRERGASRGVDDPRVADMYAMQVELDDGELRQAFSAATQAMVAEQDCCFIAKGLCHLCGVGESRWVPVVNFCPDADEGHSLCREHLRSIYRVRMEDLFAGRNRPMASRRALKCMVCSRSCPCSICVLEKTQELNRYRRWLRTSSLRGGADSRHSAPPVKDEPHAEQLGRDVDSGHSRRYSSGELSMQAQDKAPAVSTLGPKRAAKEALPPLRPPALQSERPQVPPVSSSGSRETASPSASDVINCAESEKSLVKLLTTLNQSSGGDRRTPVIKERQPNTSASPPSEPREHKAKAIDARLAANDAQSARPNDRAVKRKRVISHETGSSDEDDGYELVESPGGTLMSSRSRRVSQKPREDYSSEDDAPLWPPRPTRDGARGRKGAKKAGRPKATASTDDERIAALKASPASSSSASSASRKRKSSSAELEATDRKNSRSARSSPPRPPTRRSEATSAPGTRDGGASARRHHQDADEDTSELDTNLDYCVVCLSTGDLVCCDKCPRSFHLACLDMAESDLPEGDWQCGECRKPSVFEAFARKVELQPSVFTKCAQIIKCLKEHPFAKPFVDPVVDVPNYREIVQQPMDLSTIASKLKRNAYAVGSATKGLNLDAFASDVRLIWYNCKIFNDDGSGITRAADELAAGFNQLVDQVKKSLPSVTAAMAPAPASAETEAAADSVGNPSADRMADMTPQPAGKEESGSPSNEDPDSASGESASTAAAAASESGGLATVSVTDPSEDAKS